MDPDFWLQRWQQSHTGFHQADTEPRLIDHWPELHVPTGAPVFVPLCGKSLDMVWLAGQGHHVIGVELSQLAIDDFFAGQGLSPDVRTEPGFTIKSAGPYQLWCGDFFDLPTAATRNIQAIYDRAALIALPPVMRQRYAAKLAELSPAIARALLITLEYDQSILPGPPHSVPASEVKDLFASNWNMTERNRENTRALSPKFREHGLEFVEQAVYVMTPRSADANPAPGIQAA